VTLGVGFSADPKKSEGPAQAGVGTSGRGPSMGGIETGAPRGEEPGARAEPAGATPGAEAEGEEGAGASPPLGVSHGR